MGKEGLEYVFEPLDEYKNKYKQLHLDNVKKYFQKLVEDAKINIEENQETINQLQKKETEKNHINKEISKLNFYKGVLIFLIIIIFGIEFIILRDFFNGRFMWYYILMFIGGVLGIIVFILLIRKNISPKIKSYKNITTKLQSVIDDLTNQSWQQVQPLNDLIYQKYLDEDLGFKLCMQTLPLIKFDTVFERKRLEQFVQNYDYKPKNNKNRSKLYVRSGEINGNPFYISEDLVHHLGTKTYYGSITITWEEEVYEDGEYKTVTRSETLTASVTKPCPYYYHDKYLVYANDAAPDLCFSRTETDVEEMSEKEIERRVSREIKNLEKKSQKAIAKGNNYTVMGHPEFEVLFGAQNRNNEVQFRLLFTPLARKQLLVLMKDKKYGYGDEFNFVKDHKINYLYPKHLKKFELTINPKYFWSNDYKEVENRFISYHVEMFRQIYFAFAPILAIPLYQQTKSQDFIYEESTHNSNLSYYEHEYVANNMSINELIHPLSSTKNILKTKIVKKNLESDIVEITAYGYRTVARVDYVTELGDDGEYHSIPVEWIEYIPVEKTSTIEIKHIKEEEMSTAEKIRKFIDELKNNKKLLEKEIYQKGSIIAYLLSESIKE